MFGFDKDLQILVVAGISGTLVKLILDPEDSWKAWVAQAVVGVLCAIFLGGLASYYLDAGPAGTAGCGFVFGSMGERGLAAIQRRLLDKEKQK
tara:strand:- start:16620 stop:16898 length:279 start_codon:yes stop_codon:yes gene_type:complete